MSVYDSPSSDEESADEETACDVGEIPSLEQERSFLLRRVSQLGRSVRFNSSKFSSFSLLWNYEIAVTFCFFLCFC